MSDLRSREQKKIDGDRDVYRPPTTPRTAAMPRWADRHQHEGVWFVREAEAAAPAAPSEPRTAATDVDPIERAAYRIGLALIPVIARELREAEAAAPAAPGLDVAIGEHVRSRDFWHRCGETCAGDIAARLLRDKTP